MLCARTNIFTATLLIFLSTIVANAAKATDEEICDVQADSALGLEDYSAAVMLHLKHLSSHPNDALAHYHLGFAFSMMGRDTDEIGEYLKAAKLGLKKWDLFLNLGLAYFERNQLAQATARLETAATLGPEHAETHFNLALAYERQNRLRAALREITVAQRLAPQDLQAWNTNATIRAEMDDLSTAHNIQIHLVQKAPDYAPAPTIPASLAR